MGYNEAEVNRMKQAINRFIDWFEARFNFVIDILALLGGAFCIFLAVFVFVAALLEQEALLTVVEVVAAPGVIGFFGILMLFALRITRSLTRKP